MRTIACTVVATLVLVSGPIARGQGKARTLVAVWAHADDEGPAERRGDDVHGVAGGPDEANQNHRENADAVEVVGPGGQEQPGDNQDSSRGAPERRCRQDRAGAAEL